MDFGQESVGGSSPQPGRFGRFYLQELINSGGMADIWVASDQQGKHFALRKLHKKLRFNFVARRRFLRGCEILSKIHDHQNAEYSGFRGHECYYCNEHHCFTQWS